MRLIGTTEVVPFQRMRLSRAFRILQSPARDSWATRRPNCLRLPGFVFGAAELLEVAAVTFWLAGIADLTAVMDDLVGEVDPAVRREDAHQLLLHLLGRVSFGHAEAAGDAEDVGVDDDAFRLFEADAENDVGSFAGCAGDGYELGEGFGDLAVEFGADFAGGALDGLGLVVEEAGGADEGFELREGGLGHGRWGGEALEELRCDHVDADVGALGGEDGGNEQLPGRGVSEGAFDGGVGLVETLEDGGDTVRGEVAAQRLLRGFLGE